jgi:tRNA dimethylallyltransferase
MIVSGIPKPRLIILLGPTGVGKTAIALRIAEQCGGEIISADSMQVYRGMDIGTAKPTPEERRRVRHHLLDVADPDEPFHVSRYCDLARGVIARLRREGKPVIVAGGTGLYIRALLGGLINGPGADESLRQTMKEEVQQGGVSALYEKLRSRDAKAAERINPHDTVRIIRALEVLELTGRSISDYQREHRFREKPYETLKIGLTLPREQLQARIAIRADRMIADGFVDEVRRLLAGGYDRSLKPMQSLGYRHLVAHIDGEQNLETAIRLIKRDTSHYAKRQMTFFAADREISWLTPEDHAAAAERIGLFLGGS